MQLFCNATVVIATHSDDQKIDPALYGAGVEILVVSDQLELDRFGPAPVLGEDDRRPFARPVVAGDLLLTTIKAECRRRIYAIASAETQMNMATAAGVIGGKTAASRYVDEVAILTNVGDALDWVAAMRAAILVLVADPQLDYLDDANWPNCPANVVAVADLF